MVRDPFAGDGFVFPVTMCTRERRLFLKRANEIHALLYITKHSYDETNKIYQTRIRELPKKENNFKNIGVKPTLLTDLMVYDIHPLFFKLLSAA